MFDSSRRFTGCREHGSKDYASGYWRRSERSSSAGFWRKYVYRFANLPRTARFVTGGNTVTMMTPLIHTTALTATGILAVPTAGKAAVPLGKPEQPITLQLNQMLLQWQQQASQLQGARAGMGSLLTLLSTLHMQFPQAMPELLTTLQNRLQAWLLGPRQLSDAAKVRQQVLQSGLFMENNLANGEALETVLNDVKTQFFQILTMTNPNRQLLLQGGLPVFVDLLPSAARSLQPRMGKSGQSGRTVAGRQLQAYLQCNGDDQRAGSADTVVTSWLAQQTEESLRQLVENQLRCQRRGNDTSWYLELLVQLDEKDPVQTMPLQITEHGALPETAQWALRFTLDLPRLGAIGVHMQLHGRRVEVVLEGSTAVSAAMQFRQQRQLHAAFAAKGLALTTLTHRTASHNG